MQSESAVENRAPVRGRGRKRGSGSEEGPVFVDNSGRRARLVRRFATLLCVLSLGYVAVLGLAFMGWGTSLSDSITPFGGGRAGSAPGGYGQQGGRDGVAPTGAPTGTPPTKPTGTPPSGTATGSAPTPAASASTGAN
ncbi:hypothetical protein [Streptomyces sp. SAS_270]|uniref:hypothetical protein n=1 Tax=Streptomyces sp. SAS_270 TaxID=3412748 RepID=UPI00403CCD8A